MHRREVQMLHFCGILTRLVIFALSLLLAEGSVFAETAKEFCGCLLFVDDAKSFDDFGPLKDLPFSGLTRSWYRFGQETPSKSYKLRTRFVDELRSRNISLGGGGSPSVINNLDLKNPEFEAGWLSRNLDGTIYQDGEKKCGSVSIASFRAYLISKMLEQVELGVTELYLGESHGSVRFDDYTLGIRGESGFIQWIRSKYLKQSKKWWQTYLGDLGVKILKRAPVTRSCNA